ncbi:MAG: hypothetical protein ACOCXT_05825, partial [Candidatus Dojkabacteria bacterium]
MIDMTAIVIIELVLLVFTTGGLFFLYNHIKIERKQKEEALEKSKNLTEAEKLALLDTISRQKISEAERKAQEIVQKTQKDILNKKRELNDLERASLERDQILEEKSQKLIEKEKKVLLARDEIEKDREAIRA